MAKNSNNSMERALYLIGGWLAVATAVLYVLLILNANFTFLPVAVLNVFRVILVYMPLVLVAIVGLGFTYERSFTLRVIFIVLLAIIVLFQFFPGTWANFAGIFG